MELVVEIVTRSEKVLHVVPVSGEQITIGRAYNCDVILQEEHVCPVHANITMTDEGDLVITDESDVNGIKDKHRNVLGHRHIFSSGEVFQLGKSYVRILAKTHPVPAAKKINPLEEFFTSLNTWYWSLGAMIAFTLLLFYTQHQEIYRDIAMTKTAIKAFAMTLVLSIVPIVIAIAARIFKKEVKFFAIVTFFFLYAFVVRVFSSFGEVLSFNWGEVSAVHWLGEIAIFFFMSLLLWVSFYLASNMSIKRISTVSLSLTAVFFTLIYVHATSDDNVSLNPSVSTSVLPSSFILTKPIEVEDYLKNTGSLFDAALEEAQRRNKEADEK